MRDEQIRQTEMEATENGRKAWIVAHGSERLKKCVEHGYDCDDLYVIELAEVEYPGLYYDKSNEVRDGRISNPSMSALNLLEEFQKQYPHAQAKIVFATSLPDEAFGEDEFDEEFEGCTAIMLKDSRLPKRVFKFLWLNTGFREVG